MIRLPKGRVLQKNLDTTYVRLDGVLHSLSLETFSGYVRAVFARSEGLVFFRDADVVAAVMERDGSVISGLDGLIALLAAVRAERAFLDLCRLDPDLLQAVLGVSHATPSAFPRDGATATGPDVSAHAVALRLSGAAMKEGREGETWYWFADGHPVGRWSPVGETWSPGAAPDGEGAGTWSIWHHAGAADLRTIDLADHKRRTLAAMREAADRHIPGFGSTLLDLEVRRRQPAEVHRWARWQFSQLAVALARRSALIVGPRRARVLGDELADRVAHLVDAGV